MVLHHVHVTSRCESHAATHVVVPLRTKQYA